jgi:ATP-dependent Lon protease
MGKKQNNKKIIEISSDSNTDSNTDSDYETETETNEDNESIENSETNEDNMSDIDMQEYRKILKKLYPSKFIDKKINSKNKLKKNTKCSKIEPKITKSSKLKNKIITKEKTKGKSKENKIIKKSKKKYENSDESEDEDEDEDEIELLQNSKNNIFFIVNGNIDDEYYDEDSEDYDSDDYSSDDDSDYSSDDSSDDDSDNDSDDGNNTKDKQSPVTKEKQIKIKKQKYLDSKKIQLNILDNLLELKKNTANANEKSINKYIKVCNTEIEKIDKKIKKIEKNDKGKNNILFKKIIQGQKSGNDFHFFNKQSLESQNEIINKLQEINKLTVSEKPYRIALIESDIPIKYKSVAMEKVQNLKELEPGQNEYNKIKNWVDNFMKIPFNKYSTLDIDFNDTKICNNYLSNSAKILDDVVYGLNDAKLQIMQMIGLLISNPSAIGSSIGIQGPMGTGKTTLIKNGISKILNRPMVFMGLGGATDVSFLEGHSYTYEGSKWGKILQLLIESNCMNPVFCFDELDKISDTPKGQEISDFLIKLIDTTQNSGIEDRFFDMSFDLSKCLFIFTYNDASKINPILRDRMYKINTKGYDMKEKKIISNNYLLPNIREQIKFNNEDIIITDDILSYIIENYCFQENGQKEDGVRNLKRCLEIIHTKLNLYRLMEPNSNLFNQETTLKVELPFTVTKCHIDKILKKQETNQSYKAMYL